MEELLLIAVGAALVNNVVLSQFLGLCPFLGVSKKVETAAGMGGAVIFVLTISSFITSLIYKFILANDAILNGRLVYLQTIVFILIIAALVQFVEIVLKKYMVGLYNALGVYLPLITTNCAVLGVTILNIDEGYNFVESMVNSFGSGLGFMLAMVLFAGVRGRIENSDIPKSLQGLPITLISASLVAVSFLGFQGLVDGLFR